MEQLEKKYGKEMPWKLSDEALDDIVMRCTEHAISAAPQKRRPMFLVWSSVAASVVLIVAVAASIFAGSQSGSYYDRIQHSQPLDQVLSQLSYDDMHSLSLGGTDTDATLAYLADDSEY